VAEKGTVFLDEIGDMSLRLQSKLLRVIEEKEMVRLGSTKTINLDVRITAATNQDIPALIQAKRFRQDLFFRLNCIPITIPPLRERTEDMIPLMQYFTGKLNHRHKMNKSFTPKAVQAVMTYHFPGNVRELANVVEQSFLISKNDLIDVDDLPVQVRNLAESHGFPLEHGGKSYNDIISLVEYRVLKSAIDKYGSTHKAAKNLKISQSTIVRKMKKLAVRKLDE
jgi:transcriptional regulator with PAS, ATPase and Fis domain